MSAHHFTHNATSLFYTLSGPPTAPPILLLHGWTCDQLDWSFQLPLLLALGYQILALDLRGHGRSAAFPSPAAAPNLYTPSALAADAAALLAHFNFTQPALVVGHSLGALVAAMVAVERAELVRGLVLVDSSYYINGSAAGGFLEAARAGPEGVAELFDAGGGAGYDGRTAGWMKSWRELRTLGVRGDVIAGVAEGLFGTEGSVGLWENAEGYLREGLGAKVGEGRVPRLAVVADGWKVEKEGDVGLGVGDRVEVVHESHWLHQQGAERFNGIVEDWLGERGFLP